MNKVNIALLMSALGLSKKSGWVKHCSQSARVRVSLMFGLHRGVEPWSKVHSRQPLAPWAISLEIRQCSMLVLLHETHHTGGGVRCEQNMKGTIAKQNTQYIHEKGH